MSRWWVGGSGTWDASTTTNWATSSGGGSGASVPTATDDVFFDANSGTGTCTVNASVPCQSIQSTGSTLTTLQINSGDTISVGSSSAPANAIALDFSGFSTLTLGSATTSAISFISTETTQQTVNFNSLTTGNVTFNGAGASWEYLGGHTCGATAIVTLTAGTLNTNGQTCSWGTFSTAGSTTRTLTLGSSAITLTGTSTNAWSITGSNYTISAASSTITLSGASSTFAGANTSFAYGTINFTGSGQAQLNSSTNCTNFTRTGTATKTDALNILNGSVLTCSGTFTCNGNSVTNRVYVAPINFPGGNSSISAASVVVSNTDFQDITGVGAGSWNLSGVSGGSGNCGGCTNITFTPAVTQAWSGSLGGNWSTNLWTTRTPLPQDNVNIPNEFQAAQTITMDMPRAGNNISFVGITGNPTISLSGNPAVFGSLTLTQGITLSGGSEFYFAGRGINTITNAGNTFSCAIVIQAGPTSSSYTLNDNMTVNGVVYFLSGTFNANGMSISAKEFTTVQLGFIALQELGSRIINMGSGNWNVLNPASGAIAWNFNTTTNLTLNPQTSTINMNNNGASQLQFVGSGLTYNNVNFSLISGSEGSFLITGNNVFNRLTLNSPMNFFFTNGQTQTCNFFTCNGSTSANNVLRSTVNNYNWFLKVLAGYSVSNTDLRDSNASGSAILP